MAAIAAVSLLPKAGDVVSSALRGLGIGGETAIDRRRKTRAAELEAAALAGDRAAVLALEFDAFDRRGRNPADLRTPRDGNYSPADVRKLASDALKRLVAAGVKLSSEQRYSQLRVPLPPTQREEIVRAIVAPIADEFAPTVGREVSRELGERARPAIGGAAIAVVVVVAVVAFVLVRGRG